MLTTIGSLPLLLLPLSVATITSGLRSTQERKVKQDRFYVTQRRRRTRSRWLHEQRVSINCFFFLFDCCLQIVGCFFVLLPNVLFRLLHYFELDTTLMTHLVIRLKWSYLTEATCNTMNFIANNTKFFVDTKGLFTLNCQ